MSPKTNHEVADLILEQLFSGIPEDRHAVLLEGKKTTLSKNGKFVKVQAYIPTKIYITLKAYGAFNDSESAFFSRLAREHLHQQAVKLGVIPMTLGGF
jgi:thiazole synthase ThiGH ThiG subunit